MGKSRIVVLGSIIATCIFASFFGGNIAYSLFYFTLAIPLGALGYVVYVYCRFKIYQSVETKTVVKGEPVPYRIELSNEDKVTYHSIKMNFFREKSYVLDINEEETYCMIPEEKCNIRSMLVCRYRGEYEVGVDSVKITDFFNLFSITYPLLSKLKVIVLPRVIDLVDSHIIFINQDPKQSLYTRKKQEEEISAESRKYQYGDSKKMIHWKLSAKKQMLMSRMTAAIPQKGVLLMLDLLGMKGKEIEKVMIQDLIIESMLALSKYSLNKKIPCEVAWVERNIVTFAINNYLDFQSLYQKSSTIQFDAHLTLDKVIQAKEKQHGDNKQYILITHQLTSSLYTTLMSMYSRGNQGTIILAQTDLSIEMKQLIDLFEKSHLRVVCINPQIKLEEVL